MRRQLSSIGRDGRGAAVVEFALASLLLAFMLGGLIALALGIQSQSRVQDSAQAGIRYAQKNGYDQAGISHAIETGSSLSGVTADPAPESFCGCFVNSRLSVTSCTSTCNQGQPAGRYVRASARATYTPFLTVPGLPSSYTLTGTAVARVQ